MTGRRLRVAVTLEQCWHDVPGGTASSALETVKALQERDDVEFSGSPRDTTPCRRAPWTPTVRMHQLPLPRIALYESWHAAALATGAARDRTGRRHPRNDIRDSAEERATRRDRPRSRVLARAESLHSARPALLSAWPGIGASKCRRRARPVAVDTRTTASRRGSIRSRLRLVPHGVAVPAVSADDVAAFVDAYQLPERYVLWCGTLEPRKNVPTLLEAFAKLRRTDPELGLVLVGPTGWGRRAGAGAVGARSSAARLPAHRSAARGLRGRARVLLPELARGLRVAGARGDGARRTGRHLARAPRWPSSSATVACWSIRSTPNRDRRCPRDRARRAARRVRRRGTQAVDALLVGRRRSAHRRGVPSGRVMTLTRRPQPAVAGAGSRRRQRGLRDRSARAR